LSSLTGNMWALASCGTRGGAIIAEAKGKSIG